MLKRKSTFTPDPTGTSGKPTFSSVALAVVVLMRPVVRSRRYTYVVERLAVCHEVFMFMGILRRVDTERLWWIMAAIMKHWGRNGMTVHAEKLGVFSTLLAGRIPPSTLFKCNQWVFSTLVDNVPVCVDTFVTLDVEEMKKSLAAITVPSGRKRVLMGATPEQFAKFFTAQKFGFLPLNERAVSAMLESKVWIDGKEVPLHEVIVPMAETLVFSLAGFELFVERVLPSMNACPSKVAITSPNHSMWNGIIHLDGLVSFTEITIVGGSFIPLAMRSSSPLPGCKKLFLKKLVVESATGCFPGVRELYVHSSIVSNIKELVNPRELETFSFMADFGSFSNENSRQLTNLDIPHVTKLVILCPLPHHSPVHVLSISAMTCLTSLDLACMICLPEDFFTRLNVLKNLKLRVNAESPTDLGWSKYLPSFLKSFDVTLVNSRAVMEHHMRGGYSAPRFSLDVSTFIHKLDEFRVKAFHMQLHLGRSSLFLGASVSMLDVAGAVFEGDEIVLVYDTLRSNGGHLFVNRINGPMRKVSLKGVKGVHDNFTTALSSALISVGKVEVHSCTAHDGVDVIARLAGFHASPKLKNISFGSTASWGVLHGTFDNVAYPCSLTSIKVAVQEIEKADLAVFARFRNLESFAFTCVETIGGIRNTNLTSVMSLFSIRKMKDVCFVRVKSYETIIVDSVTVPTDGALRDTGFSTLCVYKGAKPLNMRSTWTFRFKTPQSENGYNEADLPPKNRPRINRALGL